MTPALSLVLFDMDDVLCDYSRHDRAAQIARLAGSTPEQVLAAIWDSGFETQGDDGTVDATAYLQGFRDRIGYDLTLDEWIDARRAGTTARPEVLALVSRLRVRAAVLTNNSSLVIDHVDRIFPELPAIFGKSLYASAIFKTAKPDPACFLRCLSELGATPEEALFIDDLAENVDGARKAGLTAHQYVSLDVLAETLQYHGLLRPAA